MDIKFDVGDTTFIALVNPAKYNSFVDENWDLQILKRHFIDETRNGNIIVLQMTTEGTEANWNINIRFNSSDTSNSFRHDFGFIEVTDGCLCFVEYTCLTMAAQFKDEVVPDKYCEKYMFEIENGVYRVAIVQYYDVDNDKHIGKDDIDIAFSFTKADNLTDILPKIYWGTV